MYQHDVTPVFTRKRVIFGLTQLLEIASCRPDCLIHFAALATLHARKHRTYHLVGLLPERAHRAFCLWDPSLFHHLTVPEKPETAASAVMLLRKTAESDGAVADLQ